jgi:hypothetical protein
MPSVGFEPTEVNFKLGNLAVRARYFNGPLFGYTAITNSFILLHNRIWAKITSEIPHFMKRWFVSNCEILDFQIRRSSSPFEMLNRRLPTGTEANRVIWTRRSEIQLKLKSVFCRLPVMCTIVPRWRKQTVRRPLRKTALQMTEWTRGGFLFLFFLFQAETLTRHFTVLVYSPDKWMGAWIIWFSVGVPWRLYLCKACTRETTAYRACTACSFQGLLWH